nr:hypothetical protein [Abalone asfa-like virus]
MHTQIIEPTGIPKYLRFIVNGNLTIDDYDVFAVDVYDLGFGVSTQFRSHLPIIMYKHTETVYYIFFEWPRYMSYLEIKTKYPITNFELIDTQDKSWEIILKNWWGTIKNRLYQTFFPSDFMHDFLEEVDEVYEFPAYKVKQTWLEDKIKMKKYKKQF